MINLQYQYPSSTKFSHFVTSNGISGLWLYEVRMLYQPLSIWGFAQALWSGLAFILLCLLRKTMVKGAFILLLNFHSPYSDQGVDSPPLDTKSTFASPSFFLPKILFKPPVCWLGMHQTTESLVSWLKEYSAEWFKPYVLSFFKVRKVRLPDEEMLECQKSSLYFPSLGRYYSTSRCRLLLCMLQCNIPFLASHPLLESESRLTETTCVHENSKVPSLASRPPTWYSSFILLVVWS